MKRLRRWLFWLLIILLILVLLIVGASYFLLGTERGFKLVTNEVTARVPGLDLGNVQDDLSTGIQSDQVKFSNDQISINASGLQSKWRTGCLLDKQVCIDKVSIDELNIETFATAEPEPASEPSDITLPGVNLPVSFDIKDVLVKTLRFQPPGDAPVQELKNIMLSASSEGEQIVIHNLSTQYQNYSVSASGSISPKDDYPLNLVAILKADDIIDEHDVQAKVILSNTLESLNVNAYSTGAVELDIEGSVKPLDKTLPLNLSISAKQLGWPLQEFTMANAENVGINITGDINDYQLALQSELSGEQIPNSSLSLAGLVNPQRALLPEISILTLGGFATGNAAVSWDSGITWVTELIAKEINPAVKFEGVDGKLNAVLRANGDVKDGAYTIGLPQLSVDGTLRQFPFSLNASGEKTASDKWVLNGLALKNGENSVRANGELSDNWDMKIKADLPALQNLMPGLAGGFNANVAISGDLKAPDATVQASAAVVKFNDILIQGLSLKSNVAKAGEEQSDLLLAIGKINLGVQEFANTRLSLDGSKSAHKIDIFTDGPEKTSLDFLANGALDDQFNWQGTLQDIKLEVPAHAITLEKPTALAWNQGSQKLSIDPHCWAIQDANLCLKNKVLAEPTGDALVTLSNYRLEQLNLFLPADSTLAGVLNADIDVNWGAQLAGGYRLGLNAGIDRGGIKVLDPNGLPLRFNYDTLKLVSSADSSLIDSTLTINSKTMGNAEIAVKLDPASEEKPIGGKVDLNGFDLSFVKAFLPDFDEIGGVLSTNGYLAGNLTEPQYNGTVKVDNIVVKADSLPLAVDSGYVEAVVTGQTAAISGAIKSGEGTVNVLGSAILDPTNWRADLKVDSDALSIAQNPIIESSINTDLTISADAKSIVVRGDVDVPMATINIRELPKGATSLSDDIVIIEDEQRKKQLAEKREAGSIKLDVGVDVTLGENVNLSGYGLTAALQGDMSVALQSPNPVQLGGEIRIVEGIYKQYGQDLKISDGQILFVGPIDQTSLNIDAVRTIESEDRIAGLHIDGRLSNPEISLFTDPADKPQESILSYIILGRDIQENNDQESNLLATAALALTLRGSRGFATSIADTLGIKDFSLDARGSGDDTEVVVSGRVSDKLLLRYGRSVFEDASTLYLRYDITKKLYVEAAEGLARAVDIFYSFSF